MRIYYIVIREKKDSDMPAISEVVRNAYTSNVHYSWKNALFNEVTFQIIILLSAILFIIFGVPLIYCFISIPIVLTILYVFIYGSVLMKTAQILYEKKPVKCWVAEAYEPFFFVNNPETCWYKVINEDECELESIPKEGCRRKIIGTVSVMRHMQREEWSWLFRLAVDKSYRRKGVGLRLVKTVQKWCRENCYNYIELVMSECQEGARELFDEAGFEVKQLYHKKLFSSAVSLQMFQLRCEVRSTF